MCNCCDIDEPVHWRHATHYVTTLGVTPSHIPYAKRRTQESGARKQATRLAPGSEKNVASRVACRTHNNLLARATLRSKVECYRTSRLGLTALDEDCTCIPHYTEQPCVFKDNLHMAAAPSQQPNAWLPCSSECLSKPHIFSQQQQGAITAQLDSIPAMHPLHPLQRPYLLHILS